MLLNHVQLFYNPMDCSPPGSSVHGIFQARILEWVAISFSRGSSQVKARKGLLHCRQILYHWATGGTYACVLSRFSHVWLFATSWTIAHQSPQSMGFSRQEYLSGLPCPPPGDLPHPGIEPESLTSPALAGGFFTTSATWEARWYLRRIR